MCRRAEFGVVPFTAGFQNCIPVHVAFLPAKPNSIPPPPRGQASLQSWAPTKGSKAN